MTCWNCNRSDASFGTGFAACPECGAPLYAGEDRSAFAVLGAPRRFDLDLDELEKRYLALSRWLHPDRHSTLGPAWKNKCGELSAILNEAYGILKKSDSRLEALLSMHASPKSKEERPVLPEEFAERFFEAQETASEDPVKGAGLLAVLKRDVLRAEEALSEKIFSAARRINWELPLPETRSEELRSLFQERSYLRSLAQNLQKNAG